MTVDEKNLSSKLCEAGMEGDLKFVTLLFKAQADLNKANFDKRTVGHLAADEGHYELLEFLALGK